MRRREFIGGTAGFLLSLGGAAVRADPLSDPRTARGVALKAPRATLERSLAALSGAMGFPLTAAPELAPELLTAYVPRRSLRETMDALAELFDGTWTTLPGAPAGYRLDPEPAKAKARAAARKALLADYRRAIDERAAETVRGLKADDLSEGALRSQGFGLLLWSYLSPAERERVLHGESVTIAVPDAQVKLVHDLMVQTLSLKPGKPAPPILVTFDLDLSTGSVALLAAGLPAVRCRATVVRENSVVGMFNNIEFMTFLKVPPPAAPAPAEDSPVLPQTGGFGGSLSGTRDELVLKLGEAGRFPVLSRARAMGGSAPDLRAAGRKVSEVIAELAAQCDAVPRSTARGYHLLRSRTELLDASWLPSAEVLRAYLGARPARGKTVPFSVFTQLGALSPMQLATLQLSSACLEDAGTARETYAVLRFWRALPPPLRDALFSEQGLDVKALPHTHLHVLLDVRERRGDFDIMNQMQNMAGLRLRFREQERRGERTLSLQALRGDNIVSEASFTLPVVEEEDEPVAATG